jgi:hypothetical protein
VACTQPHVSGLVPLAHEYGTRFWHLPTAHASACMAVSQTATLTRRVPTGSGGWPGHRTATAAVHVKDQRSAQASYAFLYDVWARTLSYPSNDGGRRDVRM